MTDLNALLMAAHAKGDKQALVTLYTEAAQLAETEDAKGFYLTQAYVFALETDHPETKPLRQNLIEMGREDPAG